MTRESFINTIGAVIASEAKARGYAFPSAIIAQACLESGYGCSQLSSVYHNYFGLKCGSYWKGKSVNLKTGEVINGQNVIIRDNFRAYGDMTEGVKGYFDFISTQRYANLKSANSCRRYLELIKQDGYATAPTYVEACMSIVSQYNLTQYDRQNVSRETSTTRKSVEEIAREVIRGKWGNGQVRKDLLKNAGYNYAEVQATVNRLLRG